MCLGSDIQLEVESAQRSHELIQDGTQRIKSMHSRVHMKHPTMGKIYLKSNAKVSVQYMGSVVPPHYPAEIPEGG